MAIDGARSAAALLERPQHNSTLRDVGERSAFSHFAPPQS